MIGISIDYCKNTFYSGGLNVNFREHGHVKNKVTTNNV